MYTSKVSKIVFFSTSIQGCSGDHRRWPEITGAWRVPKWQHYRILSQVWYHTYIHTHLFTLRYIEHKIVPSQERHRFYFYNTFFYKTLSSKDGFNKVQKWTQNVDIFQKEYLFVPICEKYPPPHISTPFSGYIGHSSSCALLRSRTSPAWYFWIHCAVKIVLHLYTWESICSKSGNTKKWNPIQLQSASIITQTFLVIMLKHQSKITTVTVEYFFYITWNHLCGVSQLVGKKLQYACNPVDHSDSY